MKYSLEDKELPLNGGIPEKEKTSSLTGKKTGWIEPNVYASKSDKWDDNIWYLQKNMCFYRKQLWGSFRDVQGTGK